MTFFLDQCFGYKFMAIRLVHHRFSQLKQPLILQLDSQSVPSAAAQQTRGSCWQVALSQTSKLEGTARAEVTGPSFPVPEEGPSQSQRSRCNFKKITVEGVKEEWLLYPRSRIYCIIKLSMIRISVVAQLGYFDKFYRSRIKVFYSFDRTSQDFFLSLFNAVNTFQQDIKCEAIASLITIIIPIIAFHYSSFFSFSINKISLTANEKKYACMHILSFLTFPFEKRKINFIGSETQNMSNLDKKFKSITQGVCMVQRVVSEM